MTFAPDSVLLDTTRPGPDEEAGALLFTAPKTILTARTLAAVPELLADLGQRSGEGNWLAGYFAYEAGYAFEEIAALAPTAEPLAWFGVYDEPQRLAPPDVEALLAGGEDFGLTTPRFALDRVDYAAHIGEIKRHIRDGDVYQINFTAPFRFGFEGDPVGLYAALRRKQRVGYGALVRTGEEWVLSISPELFFRRDGEHITVRPMKGTVRRGPDAQSDAEHARWLAADPKNQAENLMIVDLLRNDLSVVAEPGTVRVSALFTAERYDTLWQMTSTVEARLRDGTGYADIFRALFPCGSVTGAPKIRAMQLIDELENAPRGVYCGAVGYIAPDAHAVFNVPIRTVVLRGGEGTMGVGSGVVWDSDAEAEYDECLLKAQFLTSPTTPDFALLETMRWDDGIALLGYHLDRLRRSAAYFDYPFDEVAVRSEVERVGKGLVSGVAYKLRLTLGRDGAVCVEAEPLGDRASPFRRAVVFPEAVDSGDPFLRHKTTHRAFYERAYRWARERGYDEAILVNERGELTEGTRTNVFIRRGDALLTPPRTSGGLVGVYREHVLATDARARKEVLTVSDLSDADAVYLVNAVRGMHEVIVEGVPAV